MKNKRALPNGKESPQGAFLMKNNGIKFERNAPAQKSNFTPSSEVSFGFGQPQESSTGMIGFGGKSNSSKSPLMKMAPVATSGGSFSFGDKSSVQTTVEATRNTADSNGFSNFVTKTKAKQEEASSKNSESNSVSKNNGNFESTGETPKRRSITRRPSQEHIPRINRSNPKEYRYPCDSNTPDGASRPMSKYEKIVGKFFNEAFVDNPTTSPELVTGEMVEEMNKRIEKINERS